MFSTVREKKNTRKKYMLYTPSDLNNASYVVFQKMHTSAAIHSKSEKPNIINPIRPFIGRSSQVIKILQLLSKGKLSITLYVFLLFIMFCTGF